MEWALLLSVVISAKAFVVRRDQLSNRRALKSRIAVAVDVGPALCVQLEANTTEHPLRLNFVTPPMAANIAA